MNRQYELIVFDWDGTLMDSAGRIVTCMQNAAAETGMPVPDAKAASDIIGLGLDEAVSRLFPGSDTRQVDAVVDAYRRYWLGDGLEPAMMFAGAAELIQGLHREGFLLAVATGKSRRGLQKALDESGLGEYFHASRCADETFSKPHPQMLLDILTDLDTPPHAAIVVGDTEYDMQMANNASVACVGVSHGVHDTDRLMAHGALRCFDDLYELSDWLHRPVSGLQTGGG